MGDPETKTVLPKVRMAIPQTCADSARAIAVFASGF